ncbi:MAG TPA: hypothetical protein VH482_10035 [Thermomicrobiales bacterium]|jgi:hypothetical protein
MAAKRTPVSRDTRFRILAAEAHSWSSLLLEDDRGQRYLYVVDTDALTRVAADSADDLLAKRAYRPWRGDRSWAPLDELPLIKQAAATAPPPEATVGFPTGSDHSEAQPS